MAKIRIANRSCTRWAVCFGRFTCISPTNVKDNQRCKIHCAHCSPRWVWHPSHANSAEWEHLFELILYVPDQVEILVRYSRGHGYLGYDLKILPQVLHYYHLLWLLLLRGLRQNTSSSSCVKCYTSTMTTSSHGIQEHKLVYVDQHGRHACKSRSKIIIAKSSMQ
jgi:hypothetical protein